MSDGKQMVSIPLELLRRLHLAHYHTLSDDDALAVRASQAMDSALNDVYELMAAADKKIGDSTIEAMKEARRGRLASFNSVDDLMADLNADD